MQFSAVVGLVAEYPFRRLHSSATGNHALRPGHRIARTHLRVRESSSCGLRANGQQTASAPPQADKVEALGCRVPPPVILLSASSLNSMSPGFLALVFALSSDLALSLTLRDFAVGNLDRVIAFLLSSSIFDCSETSSVNRRHRSQVRALQRRRSSVLSPSRFSTAYKGWLL
jgi:hypothetical protein